MDQRTLYEGQTKAQPPDVESSPNGRDQYVLGQLRREVATVAGPLHVAELSVGDASLTRHLVRLHGVALTAVDISQSRLDRVTGLPGGSGVTCVRANLDEEFDLLESERFDVVIALDILEHVFDVFGFVGHCQRVLKPGGRLFLRVPNVAYVKRRIELVTGRLPITASWFGEPGDLSGWRQTWGWDGGHLHYFTLASLSELLRSSGLDVIEVSDPGTRLQSLRRLVPGLLCGNLMLYAQRPAASRSSV